MSEPKPKKFYWIQLVTRKQVEAALGDERPSRLRSQPVRRLLVVALFGALFTACNAQHMMGERMPAALGAPGARSTAAFARGPAASPWALSKGRQSIPRGCWTHQTVRAFWVSPAGRPPPSSSQRRRVPLLPTCARRRHGQARRGAQGRYAQIQF